MNHYPSYKDSGVKWIGKIPSGWNYSPLKFLLRRKISDGPHETPLFTNEGIPFLSVDGIQDGELVFEKSRFISEEDHFEFQKKCPVEKDDVLMGKAASIGKIARVKVSFDFSVWSPLAIIKSNLNKIYPVFLEYYLKSNFSQDQIEIFATSNTQKNISMDDIQRIQIIYPPLQEQQQISNYLDRKTQQIDSLIEKTQQKIELLKEQRTSLINQVVTKGLNSDVEMKDSGVEWIGEIPSGWDVYPMKYGLTMITGKEQPQKEDIKISPENVESETGVCLNLYSDYLGEGVPFTKGDILLNKLRLYLKKILFTEYNGFSMGEMIVLRTKENLINKYLFYILFNQGLIDILDSQSNGVKLPRVSPEVILNTNFLYPPIKEQQKIVEYLDEQTQKIDSILEKETQRIELLKEYRQSLISEVVTGKVDVRDEVVV